MVAVIVFSLIFVSPASRTAFSVVGGLQAHECPGGPVVVVIPPSDVVVVTGSRYEGRFGKWREITWDDSRSGHEATRAGMGHRGRSPRRARPVRPGRRAAAH